MSDEGQTSDLGGSEATRASGAFDGSQDPLDEPVERAALRTDDERPKGTSTRCGWTMQAPNSGRNLQQPFTARDGFAWGVPCMVTPI